MACGSRGGLQQGFIGGKAETCKEGKNSCLFPCSMAAWLNKRQVKCPLTKMQIKYYSKYLKKGEIV
jgi:hypothetical protein